MMTKTELLKAAAKDLETAHAIAWAKRYEKANCPKKAKRWKKRACQHAVRYLRRLQKIRANRRSKSEIEQQRNNIIQAIAKAQDTTAGCLYSDGLRMRDMEPMNLSKQLAGDLNALVKAGKLSKTVKQTYDYCDVRDGLFGGSLACRRNIATYAVIK